jgi:hypothetical protein
MKPNIVIPPSSTQRIWRVADLPRSRGAAKYRIEDGNGQGGIVTLSKRRRQVMDLLMQGPVYCASPVRISDIVHLLKRETGVEVDTEYYPGDKETGDGTYGVYLLRSTVTRVEREGVAA